MSEIGGSPIRSRPPHDGRSAFAPKRHIFGWSVRVRGVRPAEAVRRTASRSLPHPLGPHLDAGGGTLLAAEPTRAVAWVQSERGTP